MKKVCSTCHTEKNLSDFSKDKTRPDGHQYSCKQCARVRFKSGYMERYGDKVREQNKRNRDKNVALLVEYKRQHPCCLCGETETICLDFHHLDPREKDFSVGQEVQRAWSRIHAEIQKCVVLCANCHRKVHAGIIKLPT